MVLSNRLSKSFFDAEGIENNITQTHANVWQKDLLEQ